jgi:hypothetical protein
LRPENEPRPAAGALAEQEAAAWAAVEELKAESESIGAHTIQQQHASYALVRFQSQDWHGRPGFGIDAVGIEGRRGDPSVKRRHQALALDLLQSILIIIIYYYYYYYYSLPVPSGPCP